jgi:ABC-type spermidine/putrescine transport system permease subunit I
VRYSYYQGHRSAWFLIVPSFCAMSLLAVALFGLFADSFAPAPSADSGSATFTLANYAKIFTDTLYLRMLWVTVKLSFIVSLASVILGTPVAFAIARSRSPLRRALMIIAIVIPFMVSHIVKLYALTVVLGNTGAINTALRYLGAIGENDFVPLMRNQFGVMIGLVVFVLPYVILMLAGVLRRLDARLEQAAQSLGADMIGTFVHVTLPILAPSLLSAGMTSFALASVAFATPLILGGGAVSMIANAVYDQAISALNQPLASALAVVALAMTAAILLFGSKVERLLFGNRESHVRSRH